MSDLIPFLWAVEIDGRKAPLNLRGPPGFKQVFERFRECTNTPSVFFTFPLTVDEIQFGKRIGNIETCRTDHSIPTLAFRISDGGKSICYSADTIYCPEVVEFAKNADLLVHEATFLGDQESIAELTRHSTAKMAGIVGKETKAKRLALFHIPPPNDRRESEFRSEAGDEYGRDVTIGTDLAEIII